MRQLDCTHTANHSARMHTNVTDTCTVPSTVSLPTLDYLKTYGNIQKVVVERLSKFQKLSSTGMSEKIKTQRGGQVEVFVKHRAKWPHVYILAGITTNLSLTISLLWVSRWLTFAEL